MKNNKVNIKSITTLSKDWYTLNKVNFDYKFKSGWKNINRECYDRGDGAAVILYNKKHNSVILIKQFRMPAYLNGSETGDLLEVCAGLLDEQNPVECIQNEVVEETGYKATNFKKVYEIFSTPGAVTEKIHYFTAEYDPTQKVTEGGGLASENEEIEVVELAFNDAMSMIKNGQIIDAKTIILLQYLQINNVLKIE